MPSSELVVNGDFSEGVQHWRTNEPGAHVLSATTDEARNGERFARIDVNAAKTVALNDRKNTVASTVAGTDYTMSAWVKSSRPGVFAEIKAREVSSSATYAHKSKVKITTTNWVKLSMDFRAKWSKSSLDLNVVFMKNHLGQRLYVDSVSLKSADDSASSRPSIDSSRPPIDSPLKPTVDSSRPTVDPTRPAPETVTTPSESVTAPAPAGQCVKVAPSATQFGVSLGTTGGTSIKQGWDRAVNAYGKPEIVRVFNTGAPNWNALKVIKDTDLAVSFKIAPKDVLSGAYDSRLRSWFKAAPKDVQVYWTYFHEPEDNIERGQFDATSYRAAWKRIVSIANETCQPNMHATLILMGWTLDPHSQRSFDDYYPGSAYIDMLAWDPYNPWTNNADYKSPTTIFDRLIAKSKAEGKPFGIAETGSTLMGSDRGADRAAWLRDLANHLSSNGAAFVSYYDAVEPSGKYDFRLRDAASVAAWRGVVQD